MPKRTRWTELRAETINSPEREASVTRERARMDSETRAQSKNLNEPECGELPESWQTFENGAAVPNWVAGLDEVRDGR